MRAISLIEIDCKRVQPDIEALESQLFLYNEDRSVASLAGAPPQETISSEIGRHESNPVDKVAADVLEDQIITFLQTLTDGFTHPYTDGDSFRPLHPMAPSCQR